VALQVLEHALKKVDTYNAIKRTIDVEDDKLFVARARRIKIIDQLP